MELFQRSIFCLFQAFPLSECRRITPSGRYFLPVFLAGGSLSSADADDGSSQLFQLLAETLELGQFLNTDLSLTLLTPDAAAAWNVLKEKAPYLLHFVRVFCDERRILPEEPVSNPALTEQDPPLAELHLLSGKAEPEQLQALPCQNAYVIFCTGSDPQNRALCAAARALWPEAVTVCVQGGGFEVCTAPGSFVPVALKEDRLEQLGFMQHYVYCKQIDPHRRLSEILHEFNDQNYSRISSLRAAAHFQAKLCSVGITEPDPAQAASQMTRMLEEKTGLVDRLAALEHGRWVLDKVLDGYSFPAEPLFASIFRAGKVRTTHDEGARLHTALVPCNDTSHLTVNDFDCARSCFPKGADPLDKISLKIHNTCWELGKKYWNGDDSGTDNIPGIPHILEQLWEALPSEADKSLLKKIYENLCAAVEEAYQGKAYANTIFRQECTQLRQALQSLPGAEQALELLALLEQQMGPQLEFVLRKDFKSFDRLLCRTIPFQLVYQPGFRLAKWLTGSVCDLFSLYMLEPGRVDFLACASSPAELEQQIARAEKIRQFVRAEELEIDVRFTFYCPDPPAPAAEHPGITLRPVAGKALQDLLHAFLQECEPHYFETTGLAQEVLLAAFTETSAAGIPLFYLDGSRVTSPVGRPLPLAYDHPGKALTVRTLLNMAGQLLARESLNFTAKLAQNTLYWRIFKAALGCKDWNRLCEVTGGLLAGGREGSILTPKPDNEDMKKSWKTALDSLESAGALVACPEAGTLAFRLAFPDMAELLRSSGRTLETVLFYTALASCRFHDIDLGCRFSSTADLREREVDVIGCTGPGAIFVSCKMGEFLMANGRFDSERFQFVLTEIHEAASLFGSVADILPVLAAPRIKMLTRSKGKGTEPSPAFCRARNSGVILLGSEVFASAVLLTRAVTCLADGGGEEDLLRLIGA